MTHTYSVLGMDCEDCAKRIKSALTKVPGIKSLRIDVPTNTVIIQMDSHIGADALNEALRGTDYLLQDERMVKAGGIDFEERGVRKFLPLILILAVILIFTTIAFLYNGEWSLISAMRIFEAYFFIIFGGFKVLNLKGFADAYQTYDILASRSRIYAYTYPFIEITLGLLYATGVYLAATNWATIIIMGISSVGVWMALLKKERIQCACLGTVFKVPMTKVTLAEDLLMIMMAAVMLTFV